MPFSNKANTNYFTALYEAFNHYLFCTASQIKLFYQLVATKKCQFIILVKSGTSPFINSMIQTARVYCKSKGSQCCTPINLHVCIMQLV